jgi:hypothetical protein
MPATTTAPAPPVQPTPSAPRVHPIALRPRPRLFVALSILLAGWVIFLVTMYFTTLPPG